MSFSGVPSKPYFVLRSSTVKQLHTVGSGYDITQHQSKHHGTRSTRWQGNWWGVRCTSVRYSLVQLIPATSIKDHYSFALKFSITIAGFFIQFSVFYTDWKSLLNSLPGAVLENCWKIRLGKCQVNGRVYSNSYRSCKICNLFVKGAKQWGVVIMCKDR